MYSLQMESGVCGNNVLSTKGVVFLFGSILKGI